VVIAFIRINWRCNALQLRRNVLIFLSAAIKPNHATQTLENTTEWSAGLQWSLFAAASRAGCLGQILIGTIAWIAELEERKRGACRNCGERVGQEMIWI
jgi:hypothetical protein